ncbi:MAG TPA: hypothetical protein DCM86_09025 [Verrucomicrobiales bacterium]|nr:hypothetical protein [Verrucomicrobiales bacterium]
MSNGTQEPVEKAASRLEGIAGLRTPGSPAASRSRPLPPLPTPPPESILILKPSSLGDVIQAIPVLRLLRLRFPSAHIAWWVDASLTPLLEGDRDLSEVIPFHRRELKAWRGVVGFGQSVLRMRRRRFDWVLDLQGLLRSSVVSWVANGGLTAGVDDPREGAAAFYDLAVPRPSQATHAVDWYLEVLRRVGVPTDLPFEWLPQRPAIAQSILARWPVGDRRWICLQPGARWWNKRWPVRHFQEVVRRVAAADPGIGFVVLGGREDKPLGQEISGAHPGRILDLTGELSLPEMIEWLRVADLMLTNDTGPMHAAAALGIPVVGLFGPTDPRRTGPYGQVTEAVRIPLHCSPCLKQRCRNPRSMACLEDISPELVTRAIQSRWHPSR